MRSCIAAGAVRGVPGKSRGRGCPEKTGQPHRATGGLQPKVMQVMLSHNVCICVVSRAPSPIWRTMLHSCILIRHTRLLKTQPHVIPAPLDACGSNETWLVMHSMMASHAAHPMHSSSRRKQSAIANTGNSAPGPAAVTCYCQWCQPWAAMTVPGLQVHSTQLASPPAAGGAAMPALGAGGILAL